MKSCKMNIICFVCNNRMIKSDDVFYTHCGHVFHFHCLSPWIERSRSCPQCKEEVTQSKIHRLNFAFSNEVLPDSTLQEKIDSLKHQILLKEEVIQYSSSRSIILEKLNAHLKHKIQKGISEINKKNAVINSLKQQISYFKEQNPHNVLINLEKKIAQLKTKIEDLKIIVPISDVSKMVGKNEDPETFTMYISTMKKYLTQSFDKRNSASVLKYSKNSFLKLVQNLIFH